VQKGTFKADKIVIVVDVVDDKMIIEFFPEVEYVKES